MFSVANPDKAGETLPEKRFPVKMTPETRKILKHYKTVVNERRRALGLSPYTTPRLLDDICELLTRREQLFIGGQFIRQKVD